MTAVKKKRRLDSRSDLPLVYDQYKPELEGYIRHRVDSAEDTEDILQDVFYKLTKTDLQENPIEYLSAWLYQAVTNRIIDRRRKKREQALPETRQENEDDYFLDSLSDFLADDGNDPEIMFRNELIREEIELALSELPPEQRSVFELTEYDGIPYGGYYTQKQIREIVRYAAERHIEVIPEIEMPGHGLGALTAYPWLGCRGENYEVWTRWGISKDVFCAGKDSTFEFLQDVLAEVIELFPSKYIHIGGDECPKARWKECPLCQRRMKENGLKNEEELQSYFMQRIEKWLNDHGRNIIGWDEILQGGISKTATVMSWRGSKGGIAAAKAGNTVIMAPNTHCYLDYRQTQQQEFEPLGQVKYLPMRQVYALDPYEQLTPDERKYILGVQGNLWTEYIPDFRQVKHMLLPRLAAIAETGWAYDRKDFEDFSRRMRQFRKVYDRAGYNYATYFFDGKDE